MSFIRILPENLANQIAAGEVVERPASVVKELLENAIDAGACGISVQIENGGTGLIRVIDDGRGMDEDDILLSLERHATSKLTRLDQLTAITTLGFRGEAIPSIASVSKMTITSRIAAAQLGSRVEVRFGKIVKIHAMGAAPGTVIEVKNLFGNVPARRKFLKSTTTEIAHIDEVIRSYALANHRRSFALRLNERQIFDWPADSNEAARVARVMGGAACLISCSGSDVSTGAVHGYLPAPDPQLLQSARLWLFVNGRSVKDRVISHAVFEGMRGFLMKGRRAAGVIFVKIPPDQVDVNVHPAKQEVRFRQANLVHKLVEESVRRAMLALQKQCKKDLFGIAGDGETAPGQSVGATAPEPAPTYSRQSIALPATAEPVDFSQYPRPAALATANYPELPAADAAARELAPPLFVMSGTADADGIAAVYIGQFMQTYLLFELDTGGIAVIDQHAAQERLLFEQLKQAYENREMSSQLLMFPEMIELTPGEMETLEQNGPEIARLGVEIAHFGGSSFVVKAVPALLQTCPLDVLRELLARFAAEDSGGRGHGDGIENILASMACKAAIKAGTALCRAGAERLLRQIHEARIFSHCPHGRPVVKIFSRRDIQKWFSRT